MFVSGCSRVGCPPLGAYTRAARNGGCIMIDWNKEEMLSLSQAAARIPQLRGKPVAQSTVWRWARHGRRGTRLETIIVGGTECTSIQALQRFFETLSGGAGTSADCKPRPSILSRGATPKITRPRSGDRGRVMADLKRLGFDTSQLCALSQ